MARWPTLRCCEQMLDILENTTWKAYHCVEYEQLMNLLVHHLELFDGSCGSIEYTFRCVAIDTAALGAPKM